jgi:uncharacterized protein
MLRGPQTVGEIKGRSARMFEFIDLSHVEITLQSLVTLSTPLVIELPRQPGRKEARYAHLLAGEPEAAPAALDRAPRASRAEVLEGEVASLREEVASLRADVAALRESLEGFRREFQ